MTIFRSYYKQDMETNKIIESVNFETTLVSLHTWNYVRVINKHYEIVNLQLWSPFIGPDMQYATVLFAMSPKACHTRWQ